MAKSKKADKASELVIVESPAKARTINRYLGGGYVVEASMGHVRDLPARAFGIDLQEDFRPTYQILGGRRKTVEHLRKLAAKCGRVYLATDLDREGEAIAWHLVAALELPDEKVRRVVFNEITAGAIQRAFASPRGIDVDKVNAQQARRILDRIVGYQLSPLLWRKVAKGLSAGRVQSVAVRLIVVREEQIRQFVPEEGWRVVGYFTTARERAAELAERWETFLAEAQQGEDTKEQKRQGEWLAEHGCFRAEVVAVGQEPFKPTSAEQVRPVLEALGYVCEAVQEEVWEPYADRGLKRVKLRGRVDREHLASFVISAVETKRSKSHPPAPFMTATLQQAAANRLRFSASRTMRIAQALYEGINLGNGDGPTALITYMRTDSANLSAESVQAARQFIGEQFGSQYVPASPKQYRSGPRAQEAHEAIRPTEVARRPELLKGKIPSDQYRLYELIWRRFVACQMAAAEWDATTVSVTAQTRVGPVVFKATGRRLVFDGYLKVAGVASSAEQMLGDLPEGQELGLVQISPQQQFTSPPPRYTEASLVKALEGEGIGRPSTYANIIQTIQQRGYVKQMDRRFHPTPLGETVTQRLVEYFPKIMDVKFTSHMEEQLDKIEEAHLDWRAVLHEFYDPFQEALENAHQQMQAGKVEPSDQTCPSCGKPMVYRWGTNGRFLGCTGYPQCTTTCDVDDQGKPIIPQPTEHACPGCGKPMMLRRSRHGFFLGCSGYPQCMQTVPCDEAGAPLKLVKDEELTEPCDQCDGQLVVKRRGRRAFLGCTNYPNCRNSKPLPEGVRLERKAEAPQPAGVDCERCGKPMVIRVGRRGKFVACTGFPRCRNTKPIEKLEELQAASAERDEQPKEQAKPRGAKRKAGQARETGTTESAPSSGVGFSKNGKLVVERLDPPVACPKCGATMVLKRGRFGPFLSCGEFPRCKQTGRLKGEAIEQAKQQLGPAPARPKPEPTDIECKECGATMVIRTGPTGRFLGCSRYPKCKHTEPVGAKADAKP